MAIDVKAIQCPQCGSTNVQMNSDNQGVCQACGCVVTVGNSNDTHNIYNETNIYYGNENSHGKTQQSFSYYNLPSKFTKEQFLRAMYITLAKEDAPLTTLDHDVDDVSLIQHEVVVEDVVANASYSASIGYDRQESYQDTETYYEDIPYVAVETYTEGFGSNKVTKQRQVNKTRKEERQRLVTKTRTVTDWQPVSGQWEHTSVAIVENKPGVSLDSKAFEAAFNESEAVEANDGQNCVIQDSTWAEADSFHRIHFQVGLEYSYLQGNRNKDVNVQKLDFLKSDVSVYNATEFVAKIDGCEKKAMNFGELIIRGEQIHNERSLGAYKKDMMRLKQSEQNNTKAEIENYKKTRNGQVDGNVWIKTKKVSLLSLGLLALSIAVSLLVPITFAVIGAFSLAVAAFIYEMVRISTSYKGEKKLAKEEIATYEETCQELLNEKVIGINNKIDNYADVYREEVVNRLNGKLISLGLEPAEYEEVYGEREKQVQNASSDVEDSELPAVVGSFNIWKGDKIEASKLFNKADFDKWGKSILLKGNDYTNALTRGDVAGRTVANHTLESYTVITLADVEYKD